MTEDAQDRPVPMPPTPGDARSRAQAEVEAAVVALESARQAPIAERLAAAERVHEVLAANLTAGQPR